MAFEIREVAIGADPDAAVPPLRQAEEVGKEMGSLLGPSIPDEEEFSFAGRVEGALDPGKVADLDRHVETRDLGGPAREGPLAPGVEPVGPRDSENVVAGVEHGR